MELSITVLKRPKEGMQFSRFIEAMNDRELKFYARDWMDAIGYTNVDELKKVISPLIDAMNNAEFNTSENIKAVYRSSHGNLYQDWKLSLLCLTYLAFNSPHKNQKTCLLHLNILSDYLSKKSPQEDPFIVY